MEIKIKNKHVYWATESCWNALDYRFKAQINTLVTENSEDEFEQTLSINKETFVQVMNAVNSQPQGIAKEINPIMYDSLKTQILEKAQKGDTEAIEILKKMQDILVENATMLENKIINGKSQILAE